MKAGVGSPAAVSRMYAGISSGPVALCTFRLFNNLWTPFQSILIACIVGMSLYPVSVMLEIGVFIDIHTLLMRAAKALTRPGPTLQNLMC